MIRAYALLAAEPWAILPAAVPGYLDILAREREAKPEAPEPEAVNPSAGAGSRSTHKASVRDGVCEIPVRGPIFRYADMMTDVCGGATVQGIASELKKAVDDPSIKAVVLHFDTPGGQASGIGELAGQIRAATLKKPVVGYAGNMACSAGYWLMAACSESIVAPTASLGSIGTVLQVDTRKPKDQITFVSSQSPMKRSDPATKEGAGEIQQWVDKLSAVFVADVARFRACSPARVLAEFGRGGVKVGADAVACGMADSCGDFETVIQRLARGETAADKPKPEPRRVAAQPPRMGASAKMDWFQKIVAKLFESQPEAAAALMAEVGAPTAAAFTPPAPKAAEAPGKSEAEIRAEIKAETDKANREAMASFYGEQASAWLGRMVEAGKVLPKDNARLTALYVDAAMRDRTDGPVSFSAVAGSPETVSRLSALTADVEARGSNGLTVETVTSADGEVNEKLAGFKVLPPATGPDQQKASDDMVATLLSATPLGREAAAK